MAMQLLNVEQVAEKTGLSVQTIYRRVRLKTFPPPVNSMYVPEKLKNKKHWAKTEISKWVKSNAVAPKVVKLEPKEQGKAEAEDAMVLNVMLDGMEKDVETLWSKYKTYIVLAIAAIAIIIVAGILR
jgi:predicted DNA-binding transcriptional regulator AlpA